MTHPKQAFRIVLLGTGIVTAAPLRQGAGSARAIGTHEATDRIQWAGLGGRSARSGR